MLSRAVSVARIVARYQRHALSRAASVTAAQRTVASVGSRTLQTRLATNLAKSKAAPSLVRTPLRRTLCTSAKQNAAKPVSGQAAVAAKAVGQAETAAAPGVAKPTLVAATVAAGLGLAAISTVRVVPAGELAVEDVLGQVVKEPKRSGLHLKSPLAKYSNFSLKTSTMDFTCAVPSNEGLTVEVQFSVQYRMDPEQCVKLYETVGVDFEQKLIQPQVRAAVRSATSQRDAKALYTAERENVKADLIRELREVLGPRGIIIEDAPMRSITLPLALTGSIERKLQMEQESQRMDFVLQKERQEAERKRIEAKGIADFQQIVAKGIDEKTLRWKGIEATVELARSENAKVVVIGSTKDGGLPLIMGSSK